MFASASATELLLLQRANRDLRWLSTHFDEVLKEHDGEYVAIEDGKVIASNPGHDNLLKELKDKNKNPCTLLIKYVTAAATIL